MIFSTSNSNTFTLQIGTCDYCFRLEPLVTLQFGLTAVGVCDCAESLQLHLVAASTQSLLFVGSCGFAGMGTRYTVVGAHSFIRFIRIQHKSILILTKYSQALLNSIVF